MDGVGSAVLVRKLEFGSETLRFVTFVNQLQSYLFSGNIQIFPIWVSEFQINKALVLADVRLHVEVVVTFIYYFKVL